MELYLVRHGRTEWNVQKRLQGHTDIALNASGRAFCAQQGEQLKEIPFDRIYCSPLKRAYETACLMRGGREIPIVKDDRLRELSFGALEGKLYDELVADADSTFAYFFSQPERYRAPMDGESLEHLCGRATDFLEHEIEPQAHQWTRIMIVAHGAMNQALLCHMNHWGIKEFWSGGLNKNGSIHVIRFDQGTYQCM